jgi:hypothetical protein
MLHALIANMVAAARWGVTWIHYSRDRHVYSRAWRYLPPGCNRESVIAAVTVLEDAGLIEHDQIPQRRPGENAHRSRVRPLPPLLSAVAACGPAHVERDLVEPIVLRDADKKPIDYRDTRSTQRMRDDIHAQNAICRDLDLTLAHPSIFRDPNGLIRIHGFGAPIDLDRRDSYRVFNQSMQRGGRWYGGFWQNLPRALRDCILINGAPTVEVDHASLHPRMLYAATGSDPRLNDDTFDPYAFDRVPRPLAKLAVNVLINAPNMQSAIGAIAAALVEKGLSTKATSRSQAAALTVAIKRARPELRDYWGTGAGVKLQRLDGNMAANVQRDLRAAGIPVLSVHDSHIVPATSKDALVESMGRHFRAICDGITAALTMPG